EDRPAAPLLPGEAQIADLAGLRMLGDLEGPAGHRRAGALLAHQERSASGMAVVRREARGTLALSGNLLVLEEHPGRLGPGGAVADPAGQRLDLVRGQLLLGRHLDIAFGLPDHLEEEARLRITGDDGRSALTPPEQGVAGVQPQLSFLFVRPVTGDAA